MATTSDEQLQIAACATSQTESAAVRSLLDASGTREYADAEKLDMQPTDRPEVNVPESYQVVVECRDEADQQTVYERMRSEGYRCRVLTL